MGFRRIHNLHLREGSPHVLRVLVVLIGLSLGLPAVSPLRAQTSEGGKPPENGWAEHTLTIPSASRVDLGHLGIHTHGNFIYYNTGRVDVAAMQADHSEKRYRRVTVIAHCALNTDHAALPPEYRDMEKELGPIANPYGPIDGQLHGKSGWSVIAYREKGLNRVKVNAPTRFANWVAGQPKKKRRQYEDPRSYSLAIRWEERADSAKATPAGGASRG